MSSSSRATSQVCAPRERHPSALLLFSPLLHLFLWKQHQSSSRRSATALHLPGRPFPSAIPEVTSSSPGAGSHSYTPYKPPLHAREKAQCLLESLARPSVSSGFAHLQQATEFFTFKRAVLQQESPQPRQSSGKPAMRLEGCFPPGPPSRSVRSQTWLPSNSHCSTIHMQPRHLHQGSSQCPSPLQELDLGQRQCFQYSRHHPLRALKGKTTEAASLSSPASPQHCKEGPKPF